MDDHSQFVEESRQRIREYAENKDLLEAGKKFMIQSLLARYSYNFFWMGRPVIQHPQDMMAMQEIIWNVKPDLIVETGIARGGSLIMYASFLEALGKGHVLGIDIDIREHNKKEILSHPMSKRITMFEGSSVSEEMAAEVRRFAAGHETILVVLDSNHTHQHVLQELEHYAPLVTPGSYCVVYDTIIEDLPDILVQDRPWGRGNNPKTAVWEFLRKNDHFVIDRETESKLIITAAPDGYLKRIR